MAENLKSAIESRRDQDSSGHRRMHLTIEIEMRIGEQHLDEAAVRDRNLTRKHVGCDREERWLMRKRARVRERSEQELDHLQK